MDNFKVAVTVTRKDDKFFIPIWNKVHLILDGDKTDLLNLQKQLRLVKADVNQDMNKKGLKLKELDIKVEFVDTNH